MEIPQLRMGGLLAISESIFGGESRGIGILEVGEKPGAGEGNLGDGGMDWL